MMMLTADTIAAFENPLENLKKKKRLDHPSGALIKLLKTKRVIMIISFAARKLLFFLLVNSSDKLQQKKLGFDQQEHLDSANKIVC